MSVINRADKQSPNTSKTNSPVQEAIEEKEEAMSLAEPLPTETNPVIGSSEGSAFVRVQPLAQHDLDSCEQTESNTSSANSSVVLQSADRSPSNDIADAYLVANEAESSDPPLNEQIDNLYSMLRNIVSNLSVVNNNVKSKMSSLQEQM